MADWSTFSLQIPGKDLMQQIQNILETLTVFLDILKAILETVKTLLVLFGNPIYALVQVLLALITNLLNTLQRTGLYIYLDVPNLAKDPSCKKQAGGFQGFKQRLKASLVDTHDPNRPQPIAGFLTGGFILMVIDTDGVLQLITLIQLLLRLFGQDLLAPHYAAPANVKALPVGSKGDDLLSITQVFTDPPKAIAIEWSLPSTQPTSNDPGFKGLANQISTEFIPPKWIIEKSLIPPVTEVTDSQLTDPTAAGFVTTTQNSSFLDPRNKNQPIKKKIRLKDEYNDPFVKMQKYIVVDVSTNTASFLLGQLGTFRYIDTDVVPDQAYFYRVRAFSGSLAINGTTVSFSKPEQNMNSGGKFLLRWPSTDPTQPVIVGRASAVIRARIPKIPPFDVLGNLTALFLTAYSLDFQLPANPTDTFDSQGLPSGSTPPNHVGLGSLADQAGILADDSQIQLLTQLSQASSLTAISNPVTGKPPQMPWQMRSFKFQSNRLTITVASAMTASGSSFLSGFQDLMTGGLPGGPMAVTWPSPTTNLSQLCLAFTATNPDGTVSDATAQAFQKAYMDPHVRLNILAGIRYIKTFTLGGKGPDWIAVSLLRDIIPWAGQFIYDIIAKIQALADAFQGIIKEITAFIDMIERKIDTIERFIQFLISILNFLESLEVSFSLLFVPSVDGDISNWIAAIDQAQNAPTSGPLGFTGGIGIAYLAPDISAIVTALKLIF